MNQKGFTYIEVLLGLALVSILCVPMARYIFITALYHQKAQEDYLRHLEIESWLVQIEKALAQEETDTISGMLSGINLEDIRYSVMVESAGTKTVFTNMPQGRHAYSHTLRLEDKMPAMQGDGAIIYGDAGFEVIHQNASMDIVCGFNTCVITADTSEDNLVMLFLPESCPALFLEISQKDSGNLIVVIRSKGDAVPNIKALTEDNIFVLWRKDCIYQKEAFTEILFFSSEGLIQNNVTGYVPCMYEVYP